MMIGKEQIAQLSSFRLSCIQVDTNEIEELLTPEDLSNGNIVTRIREIEERVMGLRCLVNPHKESG